MPKITDTSKNPNPEWLFGANPGAIEAQEAHGQQELVSSSQLPRAINDYGKYKGKTIEDIYRKMGIKISDKQGSDNLFIDVQLPEGWKLNPTDHSMWNELLDNKGKKIASIFYKAAFYDRDSFINFE
jgi:hypothetical protein